jgi:peptide subunit release factor 1 (eRF1)
MAAGEEVEVLESDVEKHVREAGGSPASTPYGAQDTAAGDRTDRRFQQHLNRFYDRLIDTVKDADGIVIFGPGEAKMEFDKRVTDKTLRKSIWGVEAADKMTNPQLAAKVRSYFQSASTTTTV